MDRRRLFGGALALALAGATVAIAPTTAATSGTGSSTLSTELLSIEIGDGGELLGVSLVGEEATTTNGASPSAVARLHTASVGSDVVSLLNVAGPSVEVASSSSPETVTAPAVDLGAPAGQALPAGVIAGSIVPKPLTAAVDAAGAHASGGASLEGLSLAGGLISSGTIATSLGSDSVSTDSSSARTVVAENLRVLDLGALLAGLGIDPTELSLDVLSGLIASLDLEVAGVPVGETLASTATDLSTEIETLKDALPVSALTAQQISVPEVPDTGVPPVDSVVDTVDDSLGEVIDVADELLDDPLNTDTLTDPVLDLLDELGLDPAATTVEELLDTIAGLQGELQGLLDASLDALDAAPLLSIDSIEISVASKATDSVETSLADVTAKISGVHVGELGSLGGIDVTDLTAPTSIAAVDALVATIEAEVAAVLTLVDPGLAGIIDVSLFEETESVSSEGSTVKALAQLTAVTASVTPPSDLAGIIDGILAEVGLADLLAGAGLEVPTVAEAMTELTAVLAGVTAGGVTAQQVPDLGALADGVVVRLGTLVASSTFTPAAASVPTPADPGGSPSVPTGTDGPGSPSAPGAPTELPRTGTSLTFVLLAFAALLIATGLGLPQWAEATVNSRGSRHTN